MVWRVVPDQRRHSKARGEVAVTPPLQTHSSGIDMFEEKGKEKEKEKLMTRPQRSAHALGAATRKNAGQKKLPSLLPVFYSK